MLRLTVLLVARAKSKGVSYEQVTLHLEDSLRKERRRRSEAQEGFTAAGWCGGSRTNSLDQEEAHTIGHCGRPRGAILSGQY